MNTKLSRECLSAIESHDVKLDIFEKLEQQNLKLTKVISLLAQYQSISENDDDDIADNWLDSLSDIDRQVLKAFEIARGRYEQST
ncbi:hypothetical protein CJF42_01115 [Pseudoalteromonas sp. NBT06-2]|uniref:hypothetical protein n=1 Tax=Pseudoalteromonas sp. NBT06-2 TaxID=2025950 RepID=UPI000BA79D2A|nr:hypothetical protein [Pseudoalteromonas sp. NBT06-2]PAJ76115.1 hypothetical protein CJF42_01115 [Pseudoalteromonas sp. NBT06-2]